MDSNHEDYDLQAKYSNRLRNRDSKINGYINKQTMTELLLQHELPNPSSLVSMFSDDSDSQNEGMKQNTTFENGSGSDEEEKGKSAKTSPKNRRKRKVGRPFASKTLRSKNYDERFDVLHKTILRRVLHWVQTQFKEYVFEQSEQRADLKYLKKFNRNYFVTEDYENLAKEFFMKMIADIACKQFSKDLDSKKLELYYQVLADKKMALKSLVDCEGKKTAEVFYNCIDAYTKQKMILLISKNPELKFILETLFNGDCIAFLFREDRVISQNKDKYAEALDRLRLICNIPFPESDQIP
jgi:hypothetical protein